MAKAETLGGKCSNPAVRGLRVKSSSLGLKDDRLRGMIYGSGARFQVQSSGWKVVG